MTEGTETSILGLIGDTTHINQFRISSNEIVAIFYVYRNLLKKRTKCLSPKIQLLKLMGGKLVKAILVL